MVLVKNVWITLVIQKMTPKPYLRKGVSRAGKRSLLRINMDDVHWASFFALFQILKILIEAICDLKHPLFR